MNCRMKSGIASILVCLLLAGCATYPSKVEKIKSGLGNSSQDKHAVYDIYNASGANKLLALQEKGRLAQLKGQYAESAKLYAEAIAFSDALEDKALFSVGDALDKTLAVAYGSDIALDYPVVGFERMMLHVLDAFDRLALGDLDGFGVDVRNIERCRGMAQARMKREMEALQEKLRKKGYAQYFQEGNEAGKSYQAFMANVASLAPGLKNSTDNVYALFLMALYREWLGDFQEALAHYKEIETIWPGNPAVTTGIARCKGESLQEGYGELVLFVEEGFIPPKRLNHTTVGGMYLSLPNYAIADCLPYEDGGPVVVFDGSQYVAVAQTLCDLAPLAIKAHEERLRGIIGRKKLTAGITTAMITLNNEVNTTIFSNPLYEAANLCLGCCTAFLADIMVISSEKPDLRSWLLLPRQVQVVRVALKAGQHDMAFASAGKIVKLSVNIHAGETTIAHGISIPGTMRAFSANLTK